MNKSLEEKTNIEELVKRADMCLEGRDNTMNHDDRIKELIRDLKSALQSVVSKEQI